MDPSAPTILWRQVRIPSTTLFSNNGVKIDTLLTRYGVLKRTKINTKSPAFTQLLKMYMVKYNIKMNMCRLNSCAKKSSLWLFTIVNLC